MNYQKVFNNKKKLQVIKKLRKDTVNLIDTTDYYECLKKLFSDATKFKRPDADLSNVKLSTLQCYLRKLYKRNKILEKVYQEIRPKNAKIARAHGLPKVNKSFERVPSFWPIMGTIGSMHYSVAKYMSKLPNPLTQNKCSLKDTFDAAERIKKMPKELIRNEEYTRI